MSKCFLLSVTCENRQELMHQHGCLLLSLMRGEGLRSVAMKSHGAVVQKQLGLLLKILLFIENSALYWIACIYYYNTCV